jgi:lysozyme family protein
MTATVDRFPICLPYTLIQECPFPNDWSNVRNFSNDPHDPGGATMCGITQGEYNTWRRSKGEPTQSVRLLTQDEGSAIYRLNYWSPVCPLLPPGLDLQVFDESVNAGPHVGIELLQMALSVSADGLWGPQTEGAVAKITNLSAVIGNYTARREAYYRALSGFRYFGTDWIRRSQEIGAEALKMAVAA